MEQERDRVSPRLRSAETGWQLNHGVNSSGIGTQLDSGRDRDGVLETEYRGVPCSGVGRFILLFKPESTGPNFSPDSEPFRAHHEPRKEGDSKAPQHNKLGN